MTRSRLPRMRDVLTVLSSRFIIMSTGTFTMAQLIEPRASKTGGLADPYRSIRTGPRSVVKAADVLIGSDGRRYLLIDNGVFDSGSVDYKTFKVLELSGVGVYSEATTVENPITRRSESSFSPITTIYFAYNPLRSTEDKLRVPTPQYECVTYYPVKEGAKINNDIITRVERRLGIYEFWISSTDGP